MRDIGRQTETESLWPYACVYMYVACIHRHTGGYIIIIITTIIAIIFIIAISILTTSAHERDRRPFPKNISELFQLMNWEKRITYSLALPRLMRMWRKGGKGVIVESWLVGSCHAMWGLEFWGKGRRRLPGTGWMQMNKLIRRFLNPTAWYILSDVLTRDIF